MIYGDDEKQKLDGGAFENKWDALEKHQRQEYSPPPGDLAALSQQILAQLQPRRQAETMSWLNSLSDDVLGTSSAQTQKQKDEAKRQLHKWVDTLFNCFDDMAKAFNQSAQGTDLVVSCEPPTWPDAYSQHTAVPNRQDIEFRGHLATRYWALILRGYQGKVSVFLMPAANLLGFRNNVIKEADFPPFMDIETSYENDQVVWKSSGHEISFEMLPTIARELLGDLVRVASGKMSEDELFGHYHEELKLGKNVAVGYQS